MTKHYTAPELKRTSHRPGAYDAFDLPSLIGSKRVPPLRRDVEPKPTKKRQTNK